MKLFIDNVCISVSMCVCFGGGRGDRGGGGGGGWCHAKLGKQDLQYFI